MCKNLRFMLCFLAVIFGASSCLAESGLTVSEPLAATDLVSPQTIRMLDAPMSRQEAIKIVKSDGKLRASVEEGLRRIGRSDVDLDKLAVTPVRPDRKMTRVTDPNEEAYQALNWHEGFTFTPNSVPTFGPRKHQLGLFSCYPAVAWSSTNVQYVQLWTRETDTVWDKAVQLFVELPAEPALYLVTIKIAPLSGSLHPTWLTKAAGAPAPAISCYYKEQRRGSTQPTETPVSLTMLPNAYGVIGVISANPYETVTPKLASVRRVTGIIRLQIAPAYAPKGEGFNYMVFRSVNITRI